MSTQRDLILAERPQTLVSPPSESSRTAIGRDFYLIDKVTLLPPWIVLAIAIVIVDIVLLGTEFTDKINQYLN